MKTFENKIENYSPDKHENIFFTFIKNQEQLNSLISCPPPNDENFKEFVKSVYSYESWEQKKIMAEQPIKEHEILDSAMELKIEESIMNKIIKEKIENLVCSQLSALISEDKNMKMGSHSMEYKEFESNLNIVEHIPFLSLEYQTRNGTEKNCLFDFVTKETI